jgi:hypothetical protein
VPAAHDPFAKTASPPETPRAAHRGNSLCLIGSMRLLHAKESTGSRWASIRFGK